MEILGIWVQLRLEAGEQRARYSFDVGQVIAIEGRYLLVLWPGGDETCELPGDLLFHGAAAA